MSSLPEYDLFLGACAVLNEDERAKIEELLRRNGVASEYIEYSGNIAQIPFSDRVDILLFKGLDLITGDRVDPAKLQAALALANEGQWRAILAPANILTPGGRETVCLRLPSSALCCAWQWEIRCADGSICTQEFRPEQLSQSAEGDMNGAAQSARELALAPFHNGILPIGYHRLLLRCLDEQIRNAHPLEGLEAELIVAPARAFQPDWALSGQRLWGFSVQVYTLRSERNWGIGDFTDLCDLIDYASAQKASFLALNPLHALDGNEPQHCSPYSPNDRRRLNTLYIDAQREPEFSDSPSVRAMVAAPEWQERLAQLRSGDNLDYVAVAKCKREIFVQMFRHFVTEHLVGNTARARVFEDFVAAQGPSLRNFAEFETGRLHNADSLQVESDPRFTLYTQWVAESQFEACQRYAKHKGMRIGLIRDLGFGGDGGVGDVIRDVPIALAQQGDQVSVITPGYQSLAKRNTSALLGAVDVSFCGQTETVAIFRVEQNVPTTGKGARKKALGTVNHYILEHPVFASCGEGAIYCNDQSGPFATDAHKFALFCVAVCQGLIEARFDKVDVLHLHDWHASLVALLRRYMPAYKQLRELPTIYTIHNLSLQGVRPLSGHYSSLHHWYPDLAPDLTLIQDPVHWDCVNLMRAGINLSDRVHAVSPNYAREILIPTDLAHGFIGGEGLELDLQRLGAEGKLFGILNGCDYLKPAAPHRSRAQLLDLIEQSLMSWVGDRHYVPSAHFHAQLRVAQWRRRRKPVSATLISVGRVTGQKARLLMELLSDGEGGEISALDKLLVDLHDGVFIMIGSGEEYYEHFFTGAMARHENFLFLQGFSEDLADALYADGDLFLMPSSFEPCGISQMLAMRAGTPCVVHEVGGLKDTVLNGVNGFSFRGDTPSEQAQNMLDTVSMACATTATPAIWLNLRQNASNARFSWDEAVLQYLELLYTPLLITKI